MSFGVYVHVPYCRAICPYCAFNVVARRGAVAHEQLSCAMLAQSEYMAPAFAGPVRTVYFGGGTPSLLPPAFFARVLGYLRTRFDCRSLREITVEVEPKTASERDLAALRELGVNRLSIGWQSGQDAVLKRLGRRHTVADTEQLLAAAKKAGFANISVDWLIASPGQSAAEFAADAAAIVALNVAHVSCYLLTIEPRTAFARAVARRTIEPLCDDQAADWLAAAACHLQRAGYKRYEVASFARVGGQSQHNRGYWSGRPYLGLGPGAHSFARQGWSRAWRWQARAQVGRFLREWGPLAPAALPRHVLPAADLPIAATAVDFIETLSPSDILLERIMLGLRQSKGVRFDEPALVGHKQLLTQRANAICNRGWARLEANVLRPTALGLLHADASALLLASGA